LLFNPRSFVVEYVAALASDAEEAAGHELSAADAAAAEAGTVCSLTNHAYFNLADGGVREANIHRHTVRLPPARRPERRGGKASRCSSVLRVISSFKTHACS
jgi:hypothetical protein